MVPLSIAPAHGEEDSRVPMCEALQLWDIASKRVYVELMVCELDGHSMGFPMLGECAISAPAGMLFLFCFVFLGSWFRTFRRSGRRA